MRESVRRPAFALVLMWAASLWGCASNPFHGELPPTLDRTITPSQAAEQQDKIHGQPVMWGGAIVSVENLAQSTEIGVLAYPLDDSAMPKLEDQENGRFIIRKQGFLDPAVWAPGRLVTVLGDLTGVINGKIAGAPYVFPVVRADQLHLWKLILPSDTHFIFGLDFGFGL